MPAPRESGVRIRPRRIETGFATVDVVVCDLSRDPRSEDFRRRPYSGFVPAKRTLTLLVDDGDDEELKTA